MVLGGQRRNGPGIYPDGSVYLMIEGLVDRIGLSNGHGKRLDGLAKL